MKRTVIGSVFMVSGIFVTLSLIVIATFYVPEITQWRGSKLWFAIFGANDMGNAVQSLSVGIPFIIGIILFVMGLLILLIEYFKKDRD